MTKQMIRAALAGCAMTLAASALCAADASGKFSVDGAGRKSCADFVEALESKDQIIKVYAGWTQGFLSAVNLYEPETFDITPWQTVEIILAKMASHCKSNPETPYMLALGRLVTVLKPARQQVENEIVSVRAKDKSVFIYRDLLDKIRTTLEEKGFEIATKQGAFDNGFANALQGFQRQNGLPPSGLPDQITLNMLFP